MVDKDALNFPKPMKYSKSKVFNNDFVQPKTSLSKTSTVKDEPTSDGDISVGLADTEVNHSVAEVNENTVFADILGGVGLQIDNILEDKKKIVESYTAAITETLNDITENVKKSR